MTQAWLARAVFDYFFYANAFRGSVGEAWIGRTYATTPHRPVFVKVLAINRDSKVLVRQKWTPFLREMPEDAGTWVDTVTWDWELGQAPSDLAGGFAQWIAAAEEAWCDIAK